MFNKIENLYKKKSPYNRIKIRMFWAYILSAFLLWIFNINNIYIMMVIMLIIVFVATKYICEKELKTKLYLKINKKEDDGEPLNEIIHNREKSLFKEFLIEEKQYNKESLECIVNHYRTYIKQSIVGDNFWAIIGIVISIAIAFVTKEGFDFNSFEKSLPYLICFIIMTLIIYYIIKKFAEIKKFFKGEDGIYERLEIIFSELYLEYSEVKTLKKTNTKKRKTKVSGTKTKIDK